MSYFKAFALAFNMFTIFPLFKIHNFEDGINGKSAIFYPLIGFLIGSLLYGVYFLLQDHLPQIHLTVIIFALSIILTGALHLDGFSDTIDGLFVKKEKALEVMKDSHVGGMGMIFTSVFLIVKLSSFIYFDAFYLLPIVMMASRLNAVFSIYIFEYISSGVGALIKKELKSSYVIFTLLYSSLLAFVFGFSFCIIAALLGMLIMGSLFRARYQGLNGDIYGFIIEVTELILLNCLILL